MVFFGGSTVLFFFVLNHTMSSLAICVVSMLSHALHILKLSENYAIVRVCGGGGEDLIVSPPTFSPPSCYLEALASVFRKNILYFLYFVVDPSFWFCTSPQFVFIFTRVLRPPSTLSLFQQLFKMLHTPDYVQPQTRSAEGNMTSVVGAGLDELMRHVPSLRSQCIQALVGAMKEVSL